MPSLFDQDLLPEFDSVKDNDEQMRWIEKPQWTPYFLTALGPGLVVTAFGAIWLSFAYNNIRNGFQEGPGNYFWLFGLIPVLSGLFIVLKRVFSYSNTVYGFSNKRIMIRTGFIGTDFKSIDYDKISDIGVTVNIVERMFKVGTIRFYSGRTTTDSDNHTTKLYDAWNAIENPYEVYKQVKQVMVDIKTDYQYPNALRPQSNPGYHTKYDRKD